MRIPMRIAFEPFGALAPLGELKESKYQRTKHSPEQIKQLAKMMRVNGVRHPIHISNQSGNICFGHGRREAALLNGWVSYPIAYQDFESDQEEYICVQGDNAIAAQAELDLSGINKDLAFWGPFDLELMGIKDFKLDAVEKLEPQCDEDAVPSVAKESVVKLGDLFQLGNHRLLCGDSTSLDTVEQLMGGVKADMVFTDPPYGYKYESNHQSKHSMLENDDQILDFLPCAFAVMNEPAAIFVCGSHQTIHKWRPLVEQNFTYKNLIVWKKNNWSMGDLTGAFAGQHELIIFAHKGRVELRGERSRDVWEFDRDPPKDHPTQKPVDLIEFAIEKVSERNANVLDLFGGSGSTLIACEKTNRNCFMMELDPHYCSVIIERWIKYSGKMAVLLNEDGTETSWIELNKECLEQ